MWVVGLGWVVGGGGVGFYCPDRILQRDMLDLLPDYSIGRVLFFSSIFRPNTQRRRSKVVLLGTPV